MEAPIANDATAAPKKRSRRKEKNNTKPTASTKYEDAITMEEAKQLIKSALYHYQKAGGVLKHKATPQGLRLQLDGVFASDVFGDAAAANPPSCP